MNKSSAPPENIAIVCNPLAGTGKIISLTQIITSGLLKRKIPHSVFMETWPKEFTGFSDVWIVGGDGTLNFFINQYPEIKLPLAIFNGGTGNDVHTLLYDTKDITEQVEKVLAAEARPVDAGRCNEKLFINGVGIGFEGAVAESVLGKKKKQGKASFRIAILKKIFSYRSKSYSIQADKFKRQGSYLMISITNGRYAGGGFHIAPKAEIDDGWLDLILIKKISPFLRLRWLPVMEKGKHLQLSFVTHLKIQKTIIESNQLIQAHLDGEVYKNKILDIQLLPAHFLFRY